MIAPSFHLTVIYSILIIYWR